MEGLIIQSDLAFSLIVGVFLMLLVVLSRRLSRGEQGRILHHAKVIIQIEIAKPAQEVEVGLAAEDTQ